MKLHLLSISLDVSLLNDNETGSLKRQERYAKDFSQLSIIVLNKKRQLESKNKDNISIYPTNSISRWSYLIDSLLLLRKIEKPDLITTQDPYATGLIGLFLARILRIPLNVQLHSEDLFSPEWLWHSPLHALMRRVALFVLKRADSIRYLTEKQLKELESLNLVDDTYIFQAPVNADLELFHQPIKKISKVKKILMVTRLSWEKHHVLALEAFALLVKKHPNLKLTIVGEGPLSQKIKQEINKRNLQGSITLIGRKKHQDTAKLMKQSEILWLTSFYEGWPLVIAEAMAAGVGVVTISTSASGSLVEDGKTALVSKPAAPFLAKQTELLIKDPEYLYQISKKGQKKVNKNFTRKKLIKMFIEGIYQTV